MNQFRKPGSLHAVHCHFPIVLNSARADPQANANFLVGEAVGREFHDLTLPLGQLCVALSQRGEFALIADTAMSMSP